MNKSILLFSWKNRDVLISFIELANRINYNFFILIEGSELTEYDKIKYKKFLIERTVINSFFFISANTNNVYQKLYNRLIADKDYPLILNQFSRISGGLDNNTKKKIKNNIKNLFFHFLNLIEKENITTFISETTPHMGFDFLMYKAFKYLKKKTYSFERSIYLNRYMILNDYNKIPLYSNHFSNNIKRFEDPYKTIEKFDKKFHFYKNELMIAIKYFLKIIINIISLNFFKRSQYDSFFYLGKKNFLLTYNLICFKNSFINFFLVVYYFLISHKPKYNEKYILWTMSFQPERNTNPLSRNYFSDLHALKEFIKFNKKNIKIYVKEHTRIYVRNVNFVRDTRSFKYYSELNSLKNVVLIRRFENINSLIQKATAVVALNGTTVFKAAMLGKISGYFGVAWYNNFKNIYKLKNKKQIEKLFEKLEKLKSTEISRSAVHFFCKKIFYNSYKFILPQNIKNNFSKNNNLNNFLKILKTKCI